MLEARKNSEKTKTSINTPPKGDNLITKGITALVATLAINAFSESKAQADVLPFPAEGRMSCMNVIENRFPYNADFGFFAPVNDGREHASINREPFEPLQVITNHFPTYESVTTDLPELIFRGPDGNEIRDFSNRFMYSTPTDTSVLFGYDVWNDTTDGTEETLMFNPTGEIGNSETTADFVPVPDFPGRGRGLSTGTTPPDSVNPHFLFSLHEGVFEMRINVEDRSYSFHEIEVDYPTGGVYLQHTTIYEFAHTSGDAVTQMIFAGYGDNERGNLGQMILTREVPTGTSNEDLPPYTQIGQTTYRYLMADEAYYEAQGPRMINRTTWHRGSQSMSWQNAEGIFFAYHTNCIMNDGDGTPTECPEGQELVDDICVDIEFTCPEEQEQIGEECFTPCAENEIRDEDQVCVTQPCEELGNCQELCDDGTPLPCEEPIECTGNTELVGDECLEICADGSTRNTEGVCEVIPFTCPDTFIVVNGACECPIDTIEEDGVCVDEPLSCGAGFKSENDVCVPIPCEELGNCPVECDEDETLEDGECVPVETTCEERGDCPTECRTNEIRVDGNCQPRETCDDGTNPPCEVVPICEEFQTLVNDVCTDDQQPPTTPPGGKPEGGCSTTPSEKPDFGLLALIGAVAATIRRRREEVVNASA